MGEMDELMEALKSVSDCYDDFLDGVISAVDGDEEMADKIIEFIENGGMVTTSDVIEYLDVLGI